MKKANILAALFVATAFGLVSTSCTNDDEFLNENQTTVYEDGVVKNGTVTLSGNINGQATRTVAIDEDELHISFKWEVGDHIKISKDGTTFYTSLPITTADLLAADSTVARFTINGLPDGEDITNYHVYYNRDDDMFGLAMLNAAPTSATLEDINGGNGDRGYAQTISADGHFSLEHQMSYLVIDVSLPADFALSGELKSLTISATNENIAGVTTMDANGMVEGDALMGGKFIKFTPAKKENLYLANGDITLDKEATKTYYMMCAPTTDVVAITAEISDGFTSRKYNVARLSGLVKNTAYHVQYFSEPVWEDTKGLITKVEYVSSPEAGYTNLAANGLANCYVVPGPGKYCIPMQSPDKTALNTSVYMQFLVREGKYGNALVAYPDNSAEAVNVFPLEKSWSWHIWVPQEKPATETVTNFNKTSFTFMDMALGASKKGKATVAPATLYQWGRKDPFVNQEKVYYNGQMKATTTNVTPSFITSCVYPVISHLPSVNGGHVTDVTYVTKHPTTFVLGMDWLVAGSDALWGNDFGYMKMLDGSYPTGSKSVYDPCPAGYRVPPKDVWTGFTIDGNNKFLDEGTGNSAGFNVANYDSYASDKGFAFYCGGAWKTGTTAFYQAYGRRDCKSGGVQNVGTDGFYWTNTTADIGMEYPFAGALSFNITTLDVLYPSDIMKFVGDGTKGYAASIRCIKE